MTVAEGTDTPGLALVTGGHRRLGGAIAARLAREGWAVAIHGTRSAEPEPALKLALGLAGSEWQGFVADFAEPGAAKRLMAGVVKAFGRAPDLLVNSAAMFGQDRLETVTDADLAKHFAVNASAPALLTAAFAAAGRAEEGKGARSIVNLLDQRLAQPHGDQLAYTLSKYALAGLTELTARTLAPRIRVNAVAPGLTMATDAYEDDAEKRLAARMPLRRLSSPTDIADAVVYLATARAVTGQVIRVDGGAHQVAWARDFMHLDG